jgi:hypothetical protein
MDGMVARYLDRVVSKENFRVFIYDVCGTTKLVESWEEYERHMQTGLWFATLEEYQAFDSFKDDLEKTIVKEETVIAKPKRQMKRKEDVEDDFLPKSEKI